MSPCLPTDLPPRVPRGTTRWSWQRRTQPEPCAGHGLPCAFKVSTAHVARPARASRDGRSPRHAQGVVSTAPAASLKRPQASHGPWSPLPRDNRRSPMSETRVLTTAAVLAMSTGGTEARSGSRGAATHVTSGGQGPRHTPGRGSGGRNPGAFRPSTAQVEPRPVVAGVRAMHEAASPRGYPCRHVPRGTTLHASPWWPRHGPRPGPGAPLTTRGLPRTRRSTSARQPAALPESPHARGPRSRARCGVQVPRGTSSAAATLRTACTSRQRCPERSRVPRGTRRPSTDGVPAAREHGFRRRSFMGSRLSP
jgi:hypothetical protein